MSDESLFREVDEEVRQEQFKKLWSRYGNAVVGLGVLVILGVAGFQGWHYWQLKQSEAAGQSFFTAAQLASSGKADEALKDFQAISQTGFADLARLRMAAEYATQGKADEAVKIYDAVAADAKVDSSLRDLARIRAAAVLANTASFADMETRLKGFDAADNPWRHMARELLASVQFRLKDYQGADKQVQAILADPATPAGQRQRAETMAQLLQPMVTSQ
ncbi:tetratricopeptide repeat protein [Aestuariivirga sp.]|uniref:tetratricopeptide repeat protein n=1 Tax=Aestuariivirga sp. TaxID=2650926 RepID=UPI003BAB942B